MLTSSQIRGARAFLNISQNELSEKSGVSFRTIQNLEHSDELVLKANFETLRKVKGFFEEEGIKFIPPREKDGFGEGIRFVKNDEIQK